MALYGISDPRLKIHHRLLKTVNGVNIYAWTWNDEARRRYGLEGTEVGYMADEHPGHTTLNADGYVMVDYLALNKKVMNDKPQTQHASGKDC